MAKNLIGVCILISLLVIMVTSVKADGPWPWIPCCKGNNMDCCPESVKKGLTANYRAVHKTRRASPSVHKLIPTIWHRP
ncbi:hypothetical protein ACP275_14G303300 [Erythranthe tilingii]